jgi:uroporphyrinogen III methyltransferase/synthase
MGKVYLVGAGIAGSDFLTVRALALLQKADVVLVDDLVHSDILAEVPMGSKIIQVGKRAGKPGISQGELNQLLVEYAKDQDHKLVVRLKAGDPFIFGRAVEEIQALQEAGCDVEVIPGLSAALGAPLLAGIPLTEKQISRCFAVLTGHDLDVLPWQALSQLDTLVILMGSQHLSGITQRLISSGRDPQTPMAVISRAGSVAQKSWIGSLSTLSETLDSENLAPTVIVIGSVVGLLDLCLPAIQDLITPKPLSGETILVTRSETQASEFSTLLKTMGARVIEMPTLEITPPSSWDPLDQAIAQLKSFDWILLTSANAVTFFFERLGYHHQDSRALHGIQIAVVGSKTATTLYQYGIRADLIPTEFVAEALLNHFPDPKALRILFPRVESGGREALTQGLREGGATVVEVPAYESTCPKQMDPEILNLLEARQITTLTFASSKTVLHFSQLLKQSQFDFTQLQGVRIAAIGPKTAETCVAELGRVDLVPNLYTLDALAEALAYH